MGNIVLLDELTINKIAAGEVIERPASVIKEMVENSIDAGANNITVEIKNGGISYIKITDNGKGIAQDDLEIAFERHATSKIRSAEDLDVVTSMGFRGEALASISAIANVEMVSKTINQENGYKIVVEAGKVLNKEETGCQNGTSITVKNLFFNTPVRYKFLKKDYTESGYIEDVITRIALVNPDIAIKLINTGKTVIQTNGSGDLKSVIYSVYGKDIAKGILPIEYTYEDIKIEGVVGKPEIARSNRANQLFFVNKRYIKDKTVSAAIEQAFKGLIPIGKYGFTVLNITINPAKVDVNVHPAKLEVRFEEENKIFQAIYHAIKDTLLKSELVANTEKSDSLEEQEKINANSSNLFENKEREDKIETYTKQESKIKTNILEQIYNKKNKINDGIEINKKNDEIETSKINEDANNTIAIPTFNVGQGGPINTADVLEQLKQIQENIQKQVEDDPTIKLNTNYIQMKNNKLINDSEKMQNESNKLNNDLDGIQNNNINDDILEKSNEKNEEKEHINSNLENESKSEEKKEEAQDILKTEKEIIGTEKIETDKENLMQQSETQKIENFDEMYAKLFGKKPIAPQEEKEQNVQNEFNVIDLATDNISVFDNDEKYQRQNYKFIGIVFNTYIIIEMEKEMYIIDQHAAHERIMYEKVKKNYYSKTIKDSQMLLLPDIITLTHKEMDIANDNIEMFEKAGFSLEEFGENTIKLTGVPTICIDLNTKELFLETLDEINTVARTAKQEKEEKFIATVACKAAVKANMILTKEEVESLMDKLLELPNPFTCPHGRPTAIKMSKYDIERKFSRK